MSSPYETLLRPALFRLEAEKAHEVGVSVLHFLGRAGWLCRLLEAHHRFWGGHRPVRVLGLEFPNAVGLAAGFDKDGACWPAAAALGFGHVEIGTITARRQPGNDRPRVYRLPADRAVINRMGFNNAGAEAVAARLASATGPGRRRIPLGINIGKSRTVALGDAVDDYARAYALLRPHADFVVVNVSSPNTPDLRQLQEETRLRELLSRLVAENRAAAAAAGGRPVPLLVKIAPDLTWAQLDDVLETVARHGLDGIVATNTTIERPAGLRSPDAGETGGLSGPPLRARSTAIVRYIARRTEGRLPIIGVGGIDDPVSVAEKLDAGATLVQVYTGMIFRGPFLAAHLAYSVARRGW